MLIALGVTGGIGAYKAVEVARGLQKRGHDVVAVMTHARDAVRRRRSRSKRSPGVASSPISSRPARTPTSSTSRSRRRSISCSSRRRPPTSSASSRNGIADDFLSTLYTATRAPVLIAPAMNTQMFEHEAVRREPRHAGGARRAVRRAGRGLSGVRLDRQRPAGRAGRNRRRGRGGPAARGSAARPARARHRRSDLRGRRSGPLHRQPIERPDGICDCGRSGAPRRAT